MNSSPKDNKGFLHQVRQVGILTTIPFVLALGPIAGFFLGDWLDRRFGTAPLGMIALIVLGFAGSVKETIRLIRDAMRDS